MLIHLFQRQSLIQALLFTSCLLIGSEAWSSMEEQYELQRKNEANLKQICNDIRNEGTTYIEHLGLLGNSTNRRTHIFKARSGNHKILLTTTLNEPGAHTDLGWVKAGCVIESPAFLGSNETLQSNFHILPNGQRVEVLITGVEYRTIALDQCLDAWCSERGHKYQKISFVVSENRTHLYSYFQGECQPSFASCYGKITKSVHKIVHSSRDQ